MKLYTRTGDGGDTSVIGGRVPKDDARVEAYGTIDELNSCVAHAAAVLERTGLPSGDGWSDLLERLTLIQHELFDCGSDLAYADPKITQLKVSPEMSGRLEQWIDELDAQSEPIARFILPGGSEPAALLHVCRTVCRRAERRVVTLARETDSPEAVRIYLNRLSDFFFAAARAVNARLGTKDIEYVRGADVFRRNRAREAGE